MIKEQPLTIIQTPPKRVELARVEDELAVLWKEHTPSANLSSPIPRASTLTLAVLCDINDTPASLSNLIGHIVSLTPARVILIVQSVDAPAEFETWISTFTAPGAIGERMLGEQITFYARPRKYEGLNSAVLSLRMSGLPFVLYWRGQPDLDDRLFFELMNECDQILFDSSHFTARSERINQVIARLRREYDWVSFGDANWQRLLPWRELLAQFFDDPANLEYLNHNTALEVQFAAGAGGNQSQPMLMMAWLASILDWQVVRGSYRREGADRTAQFREDAHHVEILIRAVPAEDAAPGELAGVILRAEGRVPAEFSITRARGGYVDCKATVGTKVSERIATLALPEEVTVVTMELTAPRRDRNYHRALQVLEDLTVA